MAIMSMAPATRQEHNWLKGPKKKVRVQGKRSPHVVTDNYCSTLVV